METCWKRCVGLVTDFAYNYRYNIYFRTKCKVYFLLFSFALFIVALAGISATRIYNNTSETLASNIRNISGIRASAITRAIDSAFSSIAPNELLWLILCLLFSVFGFGYIIAHIALKPTRDALASQKQFIGNVAHELRTPLAIVKTNIEVALLDEGLDNALRNALLDNVDELDRSADIINNLLSLNTLINPANIPFSTVDLGDAADEAIKTLTPFARKRGVHLTITKNEFLIVRGNTTALVQVAINLIKNALTHTEKDGSVTVTLAPNYRGYIELSVADTGVGIPEHDLLHIFEPFYQADTSRTKKYGGSGLGLTIVSEIVKLHSGKIVMKSSAERGTTAIVSIPCADPQTQNPDDTHEDRKNVALDFSHLKHPNEHR